MNTNPDRPGRIIVVDDDATLADVVGRYLTRDGHHVECVGDGYEALRRVAAEPPDLVVLDLMLPGIDGLEVCRRVRVTSEVPVIMLTARGDDFDVVGGLAAGADDYVIKPARPAVLDARIRAVLRRATGTPEGVRVHRDLHIDAGALTVSLHGKPVTLTPTELRLLLTLSAAPRRVFSRQQLLEQVWEHDYLGDSRLVDNCVQRLRAKIEANPAAPEYVQTVRGFGYRFGPV
ncbi:MAG: response regulator [Trebonia sp.]